MSQKYKFDQSEIRARISLLNDLCLALKGKLDAKGISYLHDFKPAIAFESGEEENVEMLQRGHFHFMIDALAGESAPKTAPPVAQTSAQQSNPAQEKTGPLSAIEIDALKTTEKVLYGKGKLTPQECRNRIATRREKVLPKLSKNESYQQESKLTRTQQILKEKGLPLNTVVAICPPLQEIED